jgi:hypothetical protein
MVVLQCLRWLIRRELKSHTGSVEEEATEGLRLLAVLEEQIETERIEQSLIDGVNEDPPVWSAAKPEDPPVVQGHFKEEEKEEDE